MDTSVQSPIDRRSNPHSAQLAKPTTQKLGWVRQLTFAAGLGGMLLYFLVQPESTLILSAALGLVGISAVIHTGLRWRDYRQASRRHDGRRYSCLQEVIHRIETGFDVVSPVIPTIEVDGQTLVVLRTWSKGTGKAILILDGDGRAVQNREIWRKSAFLIEFTNACLPGVARNRRSIIHTNLFARSQAAKSWARALKQNLEKFTHLGMATECQALIEHWDALETFLGLRIALFQAEDSVVEQVDIPTNGHDQITAWIETQQQIHQEMGMLISQAEKIAASSTCLLTGWLENRTEPGWRRSEELEAGLKFAYLFQSLLLRTMNRWDELENPDLKPFQRGLDLARETGLMISPGA